MAEKTTKKAAAKTDEVELIPIHTIVRQASKGAEEETYSPGPDAKSFRVPAKEAERLIKLGAARLAETDEDDDEDDAGAGETGGTDGNPSLGA